MKGLLLYSSKYGSTERVSQWIAREIACSEVLLYKIHKDMDFIQQYDFYILGTPIFIGKPAWEMTDFIRKNKLLLCAVPVFVFITSWAQATVYRQECRRFLELLQHYLEPCKPVMTVSLPGQLYMQQLSDKDRNIMQRLLRRIDGMSKTFHSDQMVFQDYTDQKQSGFFGRQIHFWLEKNLAQ